MKEKGLDSSDDAVSDVKAETHHRFRDGRTRLFLCTGGPCERRTKFDRSEAALWGYAEQSGIGITRTTCQEPCKHAPVATVRAGQACAMFAEFAHPLEWAATLDYAGRARRAGTLLIDPGAALPYRFDPAHDHARFLVGHFEGEVRLQDEHRSIRNEVIGSWGTGGDFSRFGWA